MKTTMLSVGMFLASLAAYTVMVVTFGMHLAGAVRNEAFVIAVVTRSMLAGMILNGVVELVAVAGLARKERRWACLLALLLNMGPLLAYLCLLALGFMFNK